MQMLLDLSRHMRLDMPHIAELLFGKVCTIQLQSKAAMVQQQTDVNSAACGAAD